MTNLKEKREKKPIPHEDWLLKVGGLLSWQTTVFYAYFVPYSLQRQKLLLQDIEQLVFVKVQPVTQSLLGNNVDLITVGEYSPNKKIFG
ncbi:hypothetical protein [Marinomonas posidonica]|uniref:hypothetical protein n=1 Tax=Marinomonas posidonica TaxID=936476 RepID=UPI0006744C83|nr:hypothetical protein [Marinomonas posidonica]